MVEESKHEYANVSKLEGRKWAMPNHTLCIRVPVGSDRVMLVYPEEKGQQVSILLVDKDDYSKQYDGMIVKVNSDEFDIVHVEVS